MKCANTFSRLCYDLDLYSSVAVEIPWSSFSRVFLVLRILLITGCPAKFMDTSSVMSAQSSYLYIGC